MYCPMYKKLDAYVTMNNISQKSLAVDSGMAPAKISQLLNGKRRLMIEDYIILCRCMNLNPEDLFKADFADYTA